MDIKLTSQYLTKDQKQIVYDFIVFCIKKYKLTRFKTPLWVSVCKKMESEDEGDCYYDDDEKPHSIKIRVRYYESMKAILTILAHEMVHAKQFIKGQLKYTHACAYWKGENVEHVAYRKQPHEAEAYASEGGLVEEFLKTRK